MRFLMFFGLIIALVACSSLVPANAPLQLNATAGAPIVIDDEYVDAGAFTVDYPDGWRVVKLSLAVDPIHLVFVSSDETMRIEISPGPDVGCGIPETTPEFGSYWPYECRSGNGINLLIWGFAEEEDSVVFDEIFNAVVASIRFR